MSFMSAKTYLKLSAAFLSVFFALFLTSCADMVENKAIPEAGPSAGTSGAAREGGTVENTDAGGLSAKDTHEPEKASDTPAGDVDAKDASALNNTAAQKSGMRRAPERHGTRTAGNAGETGTSQAADTDKAKEAERLYDQGFQAYMSWKLDDALKLFDRAIKTDPGCYKAYDGKGIALCFKGRYDEGMELIDRALQMKPDFTYANFNKALAYKLRKDYKHALEWFDRALSYDPKDTWSYFGIACIYAEWKDADKAVEYLKKAIETDPGVKEVARREKDLDPVRNDPRFTELVK